MSFTYGASTPQYISVTVWAIATLSVTKKQRQMTNKKLFLFTHVVEGSYHLNNGYMIQYWR